MRNIIQITPLNHFPTYTSRWRNIPCTEYKWHIVCHFKLSCFLTSIFLAKINADALCRRVIAYGASEVPRRAIESLQLAGQCNHRPSRLVLLSLRGRQVKIETGSTFFLLSSSFLSLLMKRHFDSGLGNRNFPRQKLSSKTTVLKWKRKQEMKRGDNNIFVSFIYMIRYALQL